MTKAGGNLHLRIPLHRKGGAGESRAGEQQRWEEAPKGLWYLLHLCRLRGRGARSWRLLWSLVLGSSSCQILRVLHHGALAPHSTWGRWRNKESTGKIPDVSPSWMYGPQTPTCAWMEPKRGLGLTVRDH